MWTQTPFNCTRVLLRIGTLKCIFLNTMRWLISRLIGIDFTDFDVRLKNTNHFKRY
jgi:hypothetical protein